MCFESPQHPIEIGEGARRVGISSAALRMYEKRGLLPKASRTSCGYRQYGHGDLQRARLVRRARRAGHNSAKPLAVCNQLQKHLRLVQVLACLNPYPIRPPDFAIDCKAPGAAHLELLQED